MGNNPNFFKRKYAACSQPSDVGCGFRSVADYSAPRAVFDGAIYDDTTIALLRYCLRVLHSIFTHFEQVHDTPYIVNLLHTIITLSSLFQYFTIPSRTTRGEPCGDSINAKLLDPVSLMLLNGLNVNSSHKITQSAVLESLPV